MMGGERLHKPGSGEQHPVQRNARIDGLRGVSVLLVVGGHLLANRMVPNCDLASTAGNRSVCKVVHLLAGAMSGHGVELFFIISGFLITSLLRREGDARGRINLPAFYARRCFRTLPAFWLFLAGACLASALGLVHIPRHEFFLAATFQCNLQWSECSWWLGHSWSLAVEEQFYVVWPLLLACLAASVRCRAALTLFAAILAGSLYVEILRPFVPISAGMVLASINPKYLRIGQYRSAGFLATLSLLLLFAPNFMSRLPAAKLALELAAPLFLACLLIAAMEGRGALAVLARPDLVRRIGLISYSVYLWQEMFTGKIEYYNMPLPLIGVVLLFPVAIASYAWIEQPAIRFGRAVSDHLLQTRSTQLAAQTQVYVER